MTQPESAGKSCVVGWFVPHQNLSRHQLLLLNADHGVADDVVADLEARL